MVSAPLPKGGRASASKDRLRLWIRLLRASRMIESVLRERLKREFDTTLPRFDVMAALYREPEGMVMSELSTFLLVSNGNVTVIVDRLVQDELVIRAVRDGDRRTSMVRLTKKGIRAFEAMAVSHESWVNDYLHDIDPTQARDLAAMLKRFSSDWEN
ncbi:MAG: MarR family transcriptional regulator [Methylobacteriaceae bacterium]|nr:MarR family transcriptional regulator [Methylobacteriaceae bacterium]